MIGFELRQFLVDFGELDAGPFDRGDQRGQPFAILFLLPEIGQLRLDFKAFLARITRCSNLLSELSAFRGERRCLVR